MIENKKENKKLTKKQIRDLERLKIIQELDLSEYICTKCNVIHKSSTKIYLNHFKHRAYDNNLTKNQKYIFKLVKSCINYTSKNHKSTVGSKKQ